MERKYDVCVFDLDGTLVDSLDDLANSCNEALRLFELPEHTREEYRYLVGRGIANLIKGAMGDKARDEKLLRSVYDTFNLIYEEKCLDLTRPYAGIEKMLEMLKDNGVKIGVLSNKTDDFAKSIVAALFDNTLIDTVCGKRGAYPVKPEPESLNAMLAELGCNNDRCLYIGDSDIDVQTAKNGKTDFCGVEWGFRGVQELKNAGASVIARTADDITSLVLSK